MIDKLRLLLQPEVDTGLKLAAVATFFAKAFESTYSRLTDLEARQLEKGDKGDPGPKGQKGDKGDPGPKGQKGDKGVKGDRGEQGLRGEQGVPGEPGPKGKDGRDGKNGVSVVDAEIDVDGHLVLKLSNDSIVDAGPLPEATGNGGGVFVSGNAWQITVSSTAPANPSLNDLWLDIS